MGEKIRRLVQRERGRELERERDRERESCVSRRDKEIERERELKTARKKLIHMRVEIQ